MDFKLPLIEGTIINRYKRFLADVKLASGETITAHVPNTGSMSTCWEAGWKVMLTKSPDPKRKLPYTLEATHNGQSWIGVNTANANKLAYEALSAGKIFELSGYSTVKPEVSILDSRFDFHLSGHTNKPDCWVEVKNVTLWGEHSRALFPDAVSTRGRKHLLDLAELKKQGQRTAMLYIVQRQDVTSFAPAWNKDPAYAKALVAAQAAGVEIYCYVCDFNWPRINISKPLPVELTP